MVCTRFSLLVTCIRVLILMEFGMEFFADPLLPMVIYTSPSLSLVGLHYAENCKMPTLARGLGT